MILACALIVTGIAVQRVYFWCGALVALAAICAAVFPYYAVELFCFGGVVTVPAGWLSWKTASNDAG